MVPPPGWPPGPLRAVQGPVEALFVQSWGVAVHTTYALQEGTIWHTIKNINERAVSAAFAWRVELQG